MKEALSDQSYGGFQFAPEIQSYHRPERGTARISPIFPPRFDPAHAMIAMCHEERPSGMAQSSTRVRRGWAQALRLDLKGACTTLKRAEQECSALGMANGTRIEADLLWSFIAGLNDDTTSALAHARMVNGSQNAGVAYVAGILARSAHWLSGDLRAFSASRREEPPRDGTRRTRLATLVERSMEAAIELQQLRLSTAERMARGVIEQAKRSSQCSEATLLPSLVLAQLEYEKGNLVAADSAIRAVLPRVRTAGMAELAVRAYTILAACAIRQGRSEFAAMMLREGEALGEERGWQRLSAACLGLRVELFCEIGRIDDAQGALERLALLYRPGDHQARPRAVALYLEQARCRLAVSAGASGDVVPALRAMMSQALARSDHLLGVKLGLRLTAAMLKSGDYPSARETMLRLISIGGEVGLFQTFLEAGDDVRDLLQTMRPTMPSAHLEAYAASLLEHWSESQVAERLSKGDKRSEGLLTPRERKVLQLMSLGQSNKLIAQRLGIAPETVKSHAKNIFSRLGSSTRAEAVCRAASLGMI